MKRILPMIAAACATACLAACRTSSHAPTFKDLHELTSPKIKATEIEQYLESEHFKKVMALLKTMQFTPAELRRIRDSGDVRLMAGAVAVTDARNTVALEILHLAIARAPDDPVPLAALAYRATAFKYADEIAEPDFMTALDRWRKLEPENSGPYYLEAAWWAYDEKFDKASAALAEASRRPKYETYCAALRLEAVAAADFVGYPKFTARFFASTFVGETRLAIGGRSCLLQEGDGATEQIARDCVVLGKRLEAGRTLFIDEMMGIGLQLAAAKKFPRTASAAEVKRLEERRKQITEISERMRPLFPVISEKRYVAFLDEMLAGSEPAASEKLLSEYESSSK